MIVRTIPRNIESKRAKDSAAEARKFEQETKKENLLHRVLSFRRTLFFCFIESIAFPAFYLLKKKRKKQKNYLYK